MHRRVEGVPTASAAQLTYAVTPAAVCGHSTPSTSSSGQSQLPWMRSQLP